MQPAMTAPVVQAMDQAQPVKTRRLKLVLQDGRGIALESYCVDYAARVNHRGHRAQHIRMTNADDAMEVEFRGGHVTIVGGHPEPGMAFGKPTEWTLDNIESRTKL